MFLDPRAAMICNNFAILRTNRATLMRYIRVNLSPCGACCEDNSKILTPGPNRVYGLPLRTQKTIKNKSIKILLTARDGDILGVTVRKCSIPGISRRRKLYYFTLAFFLWCVSHNSERSQGMCVNSRGYMSLR